MYENFYKFHIICEVEVGFVQNVCTPIVFFVCIIGQNNGCRLLSNHKKGLNIYRHHALRLPSVTFLNKSVCSEDGLRRVPIVVSMNSFVFRSTMTQSVLPGGRPSLAC